MILWVFEKLFSLIDEKDLPENAFALRHSQVIDFMKGITPVIILGLIAAFNQWENPTAWVYLGTHGTYGILWVWKSTFGFGDKRWTGKKSWFTNFATLFGLFLYWVPIWIIASTPVNAPPFILGISVVLFGLGVFFHFASDMHKTVFLEFREKIKKLDDKNAPTLLKEKMWSRLRNPNYFGELLIYSSFCILSVHWIPFLWLAIMVLGYWYPSMVKKDKSLSRFKTEWKKYKANSWFFIPGLW